MLMDLIPPSKDTAWQTELKGRVNNLLPTGDPPHQQKQVLAEGERLEEDLPSQRPPKQAEIAILILDKIEFKLTLIKQHKEGHSILIKGKYTKRK
jgi:hypothetical protein